MTTENTIKKKYKKKPPVTAETKLKMSIAHKGEINKTWKGDKVGIHALRQWIFREFGRATKCEDCGAIKKHYYWTNIGKYGRDMTQWRQLCGSCANQFNYLRKLEIRKNDNRTN